jgi:hypothetical protein
MATRKQIQTGSLEDEKGLMFMPIFLTDWYVVKQVTL